MNTKSYILLIIVIGLVSCSDGTGGQYTKFIPGEPSYFDITFEYPSDWDWENLRHDPNVVSEIMKTKNPFTNTPIPVNRCGGSVENIQIVVYLDENPKKLFVHFKEAVHHGVETNFWSIKSEEKITINGISSYKMIMLENIHPANQTIPCESGPGMAVDYFLMTSDRLYSFTYSTPEVELKSDYYQDFVLMVESVTVLE